MPATDRRRVRAALCALAVPFALLVAAPECGQAAPTERPATASPAPVDADGLVRIALEAPKHVSYVGQFQTIRWGPRSASATIQRVEHLAPGDTRRTFLAPESLYGEYDITVGTTTTKIDPKQKRVLVTDNPSIDNVAESNTTIGLLASNYRAIVGPVEIIAARPATTVSLINKFTGERTMRLWIDNETKVVLAKERYQRDGVLAWRMRYDDIRFTNEIPADVFVASVPAGFQTVPSRHFADVAANIQHAFDSVTFKAVEPHFLPNGFKEVGADTTTLRGLHSLHIVYTDGIRALSLFQNDSDTAADFGDVKPSTTRFEGHDAFYVTNGPTTLLAWREHGLAFALVGDLDLHELTEIAVSVIP